MPCESTGYLKTDNFLAEYSGNPAPVLNNLGVYSKDTVDNLLKNLERLVSIVRTGNLITITDEKGNTVTFKVLGGNYEYILDNFAEEVVKISTEISELVLNEYGPLLILNELKNSGIVEEHINELAPSLIEKQLEESLALKDKIGDMVPGIAQEQINQLVPDMARELAEGAINDLVPDMATSIANELINNLVPDMINTAISEELDDHIQKYHCWSLVEDPDDEENPLGENVDKTTDDTQN